MASAVVIHLVTLPVEFDASARAKKLAFEYGLVSAHEREGVSKVLNAAAMTYVAAAASSPAAFLSPHSPPPDSTPVSPFL